MTSTTTSVAARDGTSLLVRHWDAGPDPWAVMVIVHGLAEHSGRYERTGDVFSEAGIDVSGQDLRGHGASGGERGHVEHWRDFLDDVEDALRRARSTAGARSVVLLGHSFGGLISADYVTSGRPAPDLLVLSSPGLADRLPGWQHAMAPILARVSPRQTIANAWGPDALSRDPEVGRAVAADPLCLDSSTVKLGAESFVTQKRVASSLHQLSIPTLVIHGAADPLVPMTASEALEALPGVERRVYPDLRHETMNEPEGPEVVADVVAWLRRQVGTTAGA